MNWYTRWLIFVVLPVVFIFCVCNIVDSFKGNQYGDNAPIIRSE